MVQPAKNGPNRYCNWSKSDPLAKMAKSLMADSTRDTIISIYRYVADNIRYDYEKASRLRGGKGYVPSPERTYEEGSGVCFDMASLLCAMLRSAGVTCRLCVGRLNGESHAWVEANDGTTWLRCDPTMASDKRKGPRQYETLHTL